MFTVVVPIDPIVTHRNLTWREARLLGTLALRLGVRDVQVWTQNPEHQLPEWEWSLASTEATVLDARLDEVPERIRQALPTPSSAPFHPSAP